MCVPHISNIYDYDIKYVGVPNICSVTLYIYKIIEYFDVSNIFVYKIYMCVSNIYQCTKYKIYKIIRYVDISNIYVYQVYKSIKYN